MTEKLTPTHKLLLASKISGVGKKTLHNLASDQLFLRIDPAEWSEYSPEFSNFIVGSNVYENALKETYNDIANSETFNDTILSVLDSDYPAQLKGLADQPPILFVRGDVKKISIQSIAIIGTREPSEHGKIIAERLTTYFADKNWQIVSGLAIGVDSIAHETSLNRNASTIAVLAHGLDTVFPKSNTQLSKRIVENDGLLISEYSYQSRTFPSNFVERDRIQAALSKAVIMVQSGLPGGSLHASRAILKYGRKLIIPYPTKKDLKAKHPKIEANLALANGSREEKMKILKCDSESLEQILILYSKDQYTDIELSLSSNNSVINKTQI